MISVIVSSLNKKLYSLFFDSLDISIGVPYEIIKIDNFGEYSLCEAYNLGANKAKFNILVFVHEDVQLVTSNWGIILNDIFEKNENIGIVGVAGSKRKSFLPTGWGTGTSLFDRINLIQVDGDIEFLHTIKKDSGNKEQVKVLDGVFLATKKEIWEKFKFDESLRGFNLYDIDFSLRITEKHVGIVTYEILLKHFSMGNYNSKWVIDTLDYHCRNEKSHLFDFDEFYISKLRRGWYKALVPHNITFQNRIKYFRTMGSDLFSIIHTFFFLFPFVGKPVFKILSYFKL